MIKTTKVLLISVVILIIWPIYYFVKKEDSNKEKYTFTHAIKHDIQNFIICSGTILPKEEVEIKTKVPGVLEEIYVKPGDSADKNQVISKVNTIPDTTQPLTSKSKTNSTKINFENIKKIHNCCKILHEKGVISKSEFEGVEANYLSIKEELYKVIKEYKIIKSGDYYSDHSNISIVATIDGVVTLLPIKIGTTIIQSNNFNEGTTIAKIANTDEMIFEGKVKVYEVGNLKIGILTLINVAINNKEEGYLS